MNTTRGNPMKGAAMQEQHEPPATHLGEAEETTHVVPLESEWPPASEDAGVYDPDEEDEDDGF